MEEGRGVPAAGALGAGTALAGRLRWLMVLRLAVTTVMLGVTIALQVRQGAEFPRRPCAASTSLSG